MNSSNNQLLIPHAEYAKKLRPLLPTAAFEPQTHSLLILTINVMILILGWIIATDLDQWAWYWLWLYLPLSLIMGNSVIVLLFSTHDLLHHSPIRHPTLLRVLTVVSLMPLWMPPTLWKIVHNRVHHNKTNSLADPDRNYLFSQPRTWGRWIQQQFAPSLEVHPLGLVIGMPLAWGIYTLRNLTSVLLFNTGTVDYVPAAFQVKPAERRAIAVEFVVILGMHFAVLTYLQWHPLKLLLGYFLPIGLGYAGILFYVYTNHMICQMTTVNDPLINSVSVKVPKLFDLLHLNFSYHTEHHIFPALNSDYYPQVQALLLSHYPDRAGYVLPVGQAWRLLLSTPRHYRDAFTFTTGSGDFSLPCPLTPVPEDPSLNLDEQRQELPSVLR